MNDSEIIQDRIRKKDAEIQSLEERLRAARIYVQALRDVLDAIQRGGGTNDSVIRTGSAVAKAREAILKAGKPIHISDLLAATGKSVTKETRASLGSSLAAYVRRGEIFTRPAPNTFGLVELGHTSEAEPLGEPPLNFGATAPRGNDEEVPF